MDWRFSAHLLLLAIGFTIDIIAQQGEKQCRNKWICPASVDCTNTSLCRCTTGYYQCIKKGVKLCRDIDECSNDRGICGPNQICKNIPGSYNCTCADGFRDISNRCVGVDTSRGPPSLTCPIRTLHPNERNCSNRICPVDEVYKISYPCMPGYREVKYGYCEDIPECGNITYDFCDAHSSCKNTLGGYHCICHKGYQRDNETEFCPGKDRKKNRCTDIDECSNDRGICGPNQICKNTPGSYNCTCADGFRDISNRCVEDYENPCNFNSLEWKEHENCDKDTACLFLQATYKLLNSACLNITTGKPQDEFNNTVNKLSDILTNSSTATGAENGAEDGALITDILKNVERLMLKSFIDQPRNQTIKTTQLSVSMQLTPDDCDNFELILNGNLMEVPCPESDKGNDNQKYGAMLIVYKESSLYRKSEEDDDLLVINSRVITGAITGKLTKNVTFQLAHIEGLKPSDEVICVFWDPKQHDWSEDGCIKNCSESNNTHTTCSCNHLSSFALLIAPVKHKSDPGVAIVSKIGLSLSIFCLVLSLLTFTLCRSLRSAHTSVLTALCSCLFLGQVLFLVGLHQTSNKILCSIIAGGLHFLFLCAFCWMSIESVLLFMTVRNLRAVNYMTSRRSNFPVMCLLGFGIPAVIVGISAAVQPDDYGTDEYCWLEPEPSSLIWSFLGPVAVLIITNTTLLVCTIVLLRNRLATLNTNVSTLKNSRSLTLKALAQLFILGCPWGIGYFQFGKGAWVISYIFTICNSLQGVYIFLVHCIFNNQVKQEYRKLFCRAQKRSSDDSTPHTVSKSINLTEITKPITSQHSSDKKVNWT